MNILDMNDQEQARLTFQLCQILENWQLEDIQQLNILGLEAMIKPRHLYQFRRGEKSFEFDEILSKRSQMILGIRDSLLTTFPANKDYGSIWLKRSVKKFKQKTPLELMLSGNAGMTRVWHFLDCTQGWRD
jgi:hypothetical protein